MVAVKKLTDIKLLKAVVEKYFSDINTLYHRECSDDTWQKVESLVNIAKGFPEVLKENWKQADIMIKRLYQDTHDDCGDKDCGIHEDHYNDKTAASLRLVFPPYPFND
jgi:hypothetical protein